jgi:replication factor C subunit 3/5
MNIPWCEKYRPKLFENILLDESNKTFLNKILETNVFPNLLFYGPPGTGKTTTIINLINKYQLNNYKKINSSLLIHLNASDDRGIDIIRNNIYNFINSNNLFNDGIKFIILDEVDYMTKLAQQALKTLIQETNKNNVKFCLICNYISKIFNGLTDEFIKIRFNNIDSKHIINLLQNINKTENLNINKKNLEIICNYYENDIRSMINYLQSKIHKKQSIIDNKVLEKIFEVNINNNSNIKKFVFLLNKIEYDYKISLFYLLKNYIFFIIENDKINIDAITNLEYIVHNFQNIDNINYLLNYTYLIVKKYNLLYF